MSVRSNIGKTSFFFFNDTGTTEIYTLSLHDALPISSELLRAYSDAVPSVLTALRACSVRRRSEEHTSELQSRENLVCRLLLEKQKKNKLCFYLCNKKYLKLTTN